MSVKPSGLKTRKDYKCEVCGRDNFDGYDMKRLKKRGTHMSQTGGFSCHGEIVERVWVEKESLKTWLSGFSEKRLAQKLTERLWHKLNEKGADLGSVSIYIMQDVIERFLVEVFAEAKKSLAVLEEAKTT